MALTWCDPVALCLALHLLLNCLVHVFMKAETHRLGIVMTEKRKERKSLGWVKRLWREEELPWRERGEPWAGREGGRQGRHSSELWLSPLCSLPRKRKEGAIDGHVWQSVAALFASM